MTWGPRRTSKGTGATTWRMLLQAGWVRNVRKLTSSKIKVKKNKKKKRVPFIKVRIELFIYLVPVNPMEYLPNSDFST